jgi:8-oxo-dGTP diphosphatase
MPKDIAQANITIDVVIFNIINYQLHILLVQRATVPYHGFQSLPWGFVQRDEQLQQTAIKVLYRETGVFCDYIQSFGVFDEVMRDPRGRIVSIPYYAILNDTSIIPHFGASQSAASFVPMKMIGTLAFDHNSIVQKAYEQLQKDIQWSDIIKHFLPRYFTIDQLKKYCEIIYNRSFEKRNFTKFISKNFTIKKTAQKEQYVAHRPASLYRFV